VITVPTETLPKNGRLQEASPATPLDEDDALRTLALLHLEHVRKFKRYLATYVLLMMVLTPVWIITQYESSPGWLKHLSSRSRYPGDWDPWLIWVALAGAFVVALAGFRAYLERPETEAEVRREVERLKKS
jgi:hypothetical protein